MKKILYISLLISLNVNAEAVFKIDNKKQNQFEVIDSKNQWISAEEKCGVIESYNTIGNWSPLVSNQSTDFNQERTIQNFDRVSCIMQEYNERLNQYRDIGEATVKVEEKESDIENRLINVTDTGLVEVGEVFNCGAYNPLLNTILTVGTFNVSQSCQQNQEGKYLYSTGEIFTYNTSVKNKNINKSVVATKENEIIKNLSCNNWIDVNTVSYSTTTINQKRTCNQEIKHDIVIKENNIEIARNNKTELKNNEELRNVSMECKYDSNNSINYAFSSYEWFDGRYETYNDCSIIWNGNNIFSTNTNRNNCNNKEINGYKYLIAEYKKSENSFGFIPGQLYVNTTTDYYGICRYKID